MKKIFDWLREKEKNIKINDRLRDYPCEDFLHNALRFIELGKPQVAYDEIRHAIIRSGGKLTEAEAKWEADCCEWKHKEYHSCCLSECSGVYEDYDSVLGWEYCPYCGKPIKISEVE